MTIEAPAEQVARLMQACPGASITARRGTAGLETIITLDSERMWFCGWLSTHKYPRQALRLHGAHTVAALSGLLRARYAVRRKRAGAG